MASSLLPWCQRETEVPGILRPSPDLNIPQEDRPLEQSHLSPGGSLEADGTLAGVSWGPDIASFISFISFKAQNSPTK